jgi:hypothetical protein
MHGVPTRPRFGALWFTAAFAGLTVTGAAAIRQHAASVPAASAPVIVQYAPSFENFPNPERGFYRQLSPFNLGAFRQTLDPAALRRYRDEGISLLRGYYIIDEFRNTPFSAEALADLDAQFAAVRNAGIKIIPRFTYSFPCVNSLEPCGPSTYGVTDAPLPRVLEHIDQLAPVLRANADVIAFMEIGFIGAWGEWHDSTNGLLAGNFTANASSAAIVARLLGALPPQRMMNIPMWHHKQAILGIAAPLTAAQAFTGTPQARIGHQDDCFGANATNGNTYTNPDVPGNRDPGPAKQYLGVDNRYVSQGGESCSFAAQAQPFVQCQNAVPHLAEIRWSALNIEYQPQVIELWRQQGCLAEVARRLGYRLRLFGAELPSTAAPGSTLPFRLGIANDGFASPYNPRAVELILRHSATRREHVLPVAADPRFWGGGETLVLSLFATVPADIPQGTYDMLLNLPDPELRGRPDYSIRLANEGVWEPGTGYNDLQASVSIGSADPGCSAPPAAPTALNGRVTNGVASVVWSPPAGAASYVVHAGSTPGGSDVFVGSVGAALGASSPVGAGFRAYVRVYAVNACGQSGPSNELLLQQAKALTWPLSAGGSRACV